MFESMMMFEGMAFSGLQLAILAIIALWDALWKAIGLWKSGRNKQIVWFVFMFILNTAGILPIIYIIWFQKKKRR